MMPANPYVGPRAFRANEQLPNRERDARDVTNLVLAERVVLLHSPSGAGKTSLVNTAVTQTLMSEGFEPTKALRVEQKALSTVQPRNRYVFGVAVDLLGHEEVRAEVMAGLDLPGVLAMAPTRGRRVLVIDQLEEILTLDTRDVEAKKEFFRQLGQVLANRGLWALLLIREDYLGALDPYLRYLPGELRMRYRLDFLSEDDALAAVRSPARAQGVEFTDEAARELVDRLGSRGPIEPVHLQVVCRQLWRDWRGRYGDASDVITLEDVRDTDVDRSFSRYFARSMDEVAAMFGADERAVRDWFEEELITEGRLRAQTHTSPVDGELGMRVLTKLEDLYLIRSEVRAGTKWHELAHDRLVGVVLEDNQSWQLRNLDSWQVAAYEWKRKGRPGGFLLPASRLAGTPPLTGKGLREHEREFLTQSHNASSTVWRVRLADSVLRIVTLVAVVELMIIIVLVVSRS